MVTISGQFEITAQQNDDFAALSGDYNPLHIDAIYARRLQFGRTVIHGIHHLLRVCDVIALQLDDSLNFNISLLDAYFPNPASLGQPIEYTCIISDDFRSFSINSRFENKTILSATIKTSKTFTDTVTNIISASPPKEQPLSQSFPPHHAKGSCELYLDQKLARDLFPSLFPICRPNQLAQILACTRIVGMKCPGMHSIFSRIYLEYISKLNQELDHSIEYHEHHKDVRVQIMKIAIGSTGVKGILDTFFRPPPVEQPSLSKIFQQVDPIEFSHQRALVIGGSRGVGETTAKILLAGGANVIVTYSQGQREAEKLLYEADNLQLSKKLKIHKLDVLNSQSSIPILFKDKQLPTHIYYFASPHIQANRSKHWNEEIHRRFCDFYLQAFFNIISTYTELADSANPIKVFFPSTIFITQPEKGYTEYAVAKASGECLCLQLGKRNQYIQFYTPRLPRMSTDQTSSIIPVKSLPTFDVMFEILKTFGTYT
jgi:MaoC dehydratase-like protein/short subunit dehydrogenase